MKYMHQLSTHTTSGVFNYCLFLFSSSQPPPGHLLFSRPQRPPLPAPPSSSISPPSSRPPPVPSSARPAIPLPTSVFNGGPPPLQPPPPIATPSPKTDTMVYVQKELLDLGQELGQGEFGSVLMGTYCMPEGGSVSTTAS